MHYLRFTRDKQGRKKKERIKNKNKNKKMRNFLKSFIL